MENWRPLIEYEGLYDISDLGNVRSRYFDPPRAVQRLPDKDGYPIVMLTKGSKRTPKRLHRLVARTFLAELENPLHREVAHLDGTRDNCCVANLKWVSRRENIAHKHRHGTSFVGERHPRAKLTEAAVVEIRARRGSATSTFLAERFGVARGTIMDIWERKRWRHV